MIEPDELVARRQMRRGKGALGDDCLSRMHTTSLYLPAYSQSWRARSLAVPLWLLIVAAS